MKTNQTILRCLLSIFCFLHSLAPAFGVTRYVWQESPSPAPPYTSWATAATNIQDAVDAAAPGDTVLVTNGVYATGGDASSRVAVNKPLSLQSVNGPGLTVINGLLTNQCIFLADGSTLSGFTLTNGLTGVWCESTNAVITNCVITDNSSGGALGGTLNRCTLVGNTNLEGGGANRSVLNNCMLIGNTAILRGGGASEAVLNNCTLVGNSAGIGSYDGSNFEGRGGGVSGSVLNNCTLTGNSARGVGGGASGSTLNNCIVYFNTARDDQNCSGGDQNYCCTTPLPTNGVGNISADPQLADISHLSSGSPCIGAGSAAYTFGTDVDGEAWGSPTSIGCDEYHAGAVTGPLSVRITTDYTTVAPGFPVQFTAVIEGRTTGSVWNLGAGLMATNRPQVTRAWTESGDYEVTLRAYNESHPIGVSTTISVHVSAVVHYVAIDGLDPVPPYSSWATAATNIQDAVGVAIVPGALVLVTNGVYRTGGRTNAFSRVNNRVLVDKPVIVRSVNGPEFTFIRGDSFPTRCAYVGSSAFLSGFTLFGGSTRSSGPFYDRRGGGVYCERLGVVSDCVISDNSAGNYGGGAYGGALERCTVARNRAYQGGGAYESKLAHCMITDNRTVSVGGAPGSGGGVFNSELSNCVLAGNWSPVGGGADRSMMKDCILTNNSAEYGGGARGSTLNNCILTANSARFTGGGEYSCTLNNCTLVGNSAEDGVGRPMAHLITASFITTPPRLILPQITMGPSKRITRLWLPSPSITPAPRPSRPSASAILISIRY